MGWRSDATIRYLATTGTVEVRFERRVRKSVRDRLVEFGGEQASDNFIRRIPVRYAERVQEVLKEEYPNWGIFIKDERPVIKRAGDKIGWCDQGGQFGSDYHNGYVGKIKLFNVGRTASRNMDEHFALHTELPGFAKELGRAGEYEPLEILAEEVLRKFLAELGAELKDS